MLLVFAGMSAKAQETRPMTESELAFYQKLMNLIKEALPHGNFGKWELRSHKESFFPTFLKETPKDEGPYHFTYDIEFSKSAETLNAEIEAVSKKMEGVTDPVAIEKIAKEMELLSQHQGFKVSVWINNEHNPLESCQGKYSIKSYKTSQTGWGADIHYASVVPLQENESKRYCSQKMMLILGAGGPIQFNKYPSNPGGTLLSTVKLPRLKGKDAFNIYNIVVYISLDEKEAMEYLNKVNWKLLKDNLSQL